MNRNTIALIILGCTLVLGLAGILVALQFLPAEEGMPEYLQESSLNNKSEEQSEDTVDEDKEATKIAYVIISNDGNSNQNTVEIKDGDTAYTITKRLEEQGAITVQAKDTSLGPFIEAINGIDGNTETNTFWFLYVNGQSATVGADALVVKEGDTIEWRYQQAQ